MSRVVVRTLGSLRREDVRGLVSGYVSSEGYRVRKTESRGRVSIRLERVSLPRPFVKTFPLPDAEWRRYRGIVRQGWSLGAYDGRTLVGLAIAEPRTWNGSLWVWEIGVAASHRRRGVGTSLVRGLARRAREAGLRAIVCETQTTNVPAIDFYRRAGFSVDGIDLSYYTNEDLERGEVAVFMKKRVAGRGGPGRRPRSRSPHTSK